MKTSARLRPRASLRATLLGWIVPALALVMGGGLWLSLKLFDDMADSAYDRSLAGALRAIDFNLSTESGGLAVELPYRMLEFFELTASGNVYYSVTTEDGLAEIGNPGLPLPPGPLVSGVPVFFDATYLGESVRAAALARPLDPPLYGQPGQRVVIQMAESIESRAGFTRAVLRHAIERDVLLLGISTLVLAVGIFMALRPLSRLRAELDARDPEDLRPVDESEAPGEVRPLVGAINRHIARHEARARAQRQFLDDASHQLRTPLAVLRTQVDFALREPDPAVVRQALGAMHEGLDRAVRMANQMLALARAHEASLSDGGVPFARLDLVQLADEAVRSLLPAARLKRLDYGFEPPPAPVFFVGSAVLLREALVNLLDNAIRYSPHGGVVTLAIRRQGGVLRIDVEDSGPGMSEADIARAGSRFRRGEAGKSKPGAGLGLAIAQTIAGAHGGVLALEARRDGPGLRASLVFAREGRGRAS